MDYLIHHPYLINIVIATLLVCLVIYKPTFTSILTALIFYCFLHFSFGILPVLFPEYMINFYLPYRMISNNITRLIAILFLLFILGMMFARIIKQGTFKTLPKNWINSFKGS